MYYNIAIFPQFVVTPDGYIMNAKDLKNFHTIMLLKVDRLHFQIVIMLMNW